MSTTHGYSRESIYKTWEHMLSRCNDKSHDSYESYGNKGIKVCLEWHDIGNFVKWANENGYKKGYYETQLWYLITVFGGHIGLGKKNVFTDNNLILSNSEEEENE